MTSSDDRRAREREREHDHDHERQPVSESSSESDRSIDAAVLADVEQTLTTLSNLDLDLTEPADLERARQELPTEPRRAELLAAALPRPLAATIEYVHPSDRQAGYWRRSPDRSRTAASTAQLKHRLAFTEASIEQRGTQGLTPAPDDDDDDDDDDNDDDDDDDDDDDGESDGDRYIPRSAVGAGRALRNRSFSNDGDPAHDPATEQGEQLLSSIREFLR